jgi:4-aminobutyrate aminotransferase-like enzyme
VFWDRAEGTNVWDVDGNRFLDLTSAFAVAGLGHGAPAVCEALCEQSTRLIHAMGDVHPTPAKAELCRLLSKITFERWGAGAARTILANSGSEAVEAALKTALLATGRPGVLSFHGGYHGLGHGALAAGGIPFFREPFLPQLAGFATQLPFPASADQVSRVLGRSDIGAILVEPVQGRGGDVVPPPDFLPMLRELCDAHGVLLILDEIYTGFHRTGRLFACEHTGVVPDVICLGKALTSGFPLSACIGRASVMDCWPPSRGEALHTSTYLGHPIGCAMALASIRQHLAPETEILVRETAAALDAELASLRNPFLGEVRGIGLMRGLALVREDGSPHGALAGEIVVSALKDGLLLLAGGPAGNVLSLTPPFGIGREEIAFAIGKIQEYLTSRAGSIS